MNKNDLLYIKMCAASPLVQKLWKPEKGDYVFLQEENHIALLADKQNKKGKIWLPTEFQLYKLGVKYGLLNWMKFDQECAQHWNYFTKMHGEHPAKKMCGLAVIMAIGENKYWRDDDWK